MDQLEETILAAIRADPERAKRVLLTALKNPAIVATKPESQRPGRGGALKCQRCRHHKNGRKVCHFFGKMLI